MSFLVTAIFLIIIAVVFLPQLTNLINNVFKSKEEKARDSQIEKRNADEGILGQINRLLAGNKIVDNAKTNKAVRDFDKAAKNKKERDAKNAGFKTVRAFEKATDSNRINSSNITKFNPPNTVGFGILSINGGKGIPDTAENRQRILNSQLVVRSNVKGARRRGVR